MTSSTPQPEFPVLTFSRGYMEPIASPDQLGRTNKTALKRGWFDQMFLVDSACRRFPVDRTEERGPDGPFLGLSLMHGRRVRVELFYGKVRQLELEAVKELVLKAMRRDSTFYEASELSLEDLQSRIRSAESFEEVFRWIS